MRLLQSAPLLLLLAASGCIVRETRPLPPPMSDAEAVERGEAWCGQHGYECRARSVARRGDLVEAIFDAEGHGARGPLRLDFGVWDRRLVRVEVPAVPPPGPRPMAEAEAVQQGDAWCRSRGYVCILEDAHVEGQARWHLRYRVEAPGHGRVGLTYDAFNRALLGVREDVRS